jgi:GT2 family glycosyltransferase
MLPDLSIIIVSWNVRELLRACLRSIERSGATVRTEIIVVDNASADGSAAMLAQGFPRVHVIANAANRGFPAANNQGIARSSGRYVMLLNPDTEVGDGALAAMVAYLDVQPQVGVLGPQLVNPDGSVQSSRRRFPTFWTAVFEGTWLQRFAPPGLVERYTVRDRRDDAISEVDWVTGACLAVRREAFAQVGGLDEGFFMYSEELDWCKRIKVAGWKIVYFPGARVMHHEGKSSEQATPARHIHFQTSKVRYFRKHHGALAAALLRLFLLALYGQQLALEAAKAALGHKRPLRRQRVAAYWQVLRSGLK